MRQVQITSTDFRPGSHRFALRQAPISAFGLRLISDEPGRDHRAPPLPFRRRPPQSNSPPRRLLFSPPANPVVVFQGRTGVLPPFLRPEAPGTVPGSSKAARGLLVLPGLRRICTAISNSPNWPGRQGGGHGVIHAGHQLNAKEFRYLRTVGLQPPFGRWLKSKISLAPLPLLPPGRHRTG